MQTVLVNRLNWKDIKEIDSILSEIDNEAVVRNEEEYYSEALLRLCRRHKTLAACKERYKEILPVAEKVVGVKNSKERTFELTVLRCMIANKLRDEGYSLADIGNTMKYDHSTISFYLNKKKDFFSLPLVFEREVRWFKVFDELLQCG